MHIKYWERGRFWVTNPKSGQQYLVDLLENGRTGKCDCPDFRIRVQPKIEDRTLRPTLGTGCKHIRYLVQWIGKVLRYSGLGSGTNEQLTARLLLMWAVYERNCRGTYGQKMHKTRTR